ncbi:40S ribosomal protein SA [Camelus dromedarius]|uniref:40S ribosomal protein SA n=1 Tax=Camelus dromedarius TaxID=9838 RepID=A0A5N4EIT7_CAMDR|nr:40S ribosomal protein SA [Camelus dromedarius]
MENVAEGPEESSPADFNAIASRNIGQRAGLKLAAAIGATLMADYSTPGTWTQIQAAFLELRLLVVTDPSADHRNPKEIEKEEQGAAEKAVTKEEFQSKHTVAALEFTATQPKIAGWSKEIFGQEYESRPAEKEMDIREWEGHPSAFNIDNEEAG